MSINLQSKTAFDLRERVTGEVILPGDASYDSARAAWNLSVSQHPAMIVVAENVQDVKEAVLFAAENQMEIAVQTTGHGVIREANNSLLIVTSRLNAVTVDANARTAYVGGGAKWAHVLEETNPVGLAPLLGSTPDVGAVGYTLGGGFGWLGRKYGMAVDSVNYFDIVTANGELLRASENEHADLFWALRGGGGNFGVVIGMEINLYPVHEIYAGNLFYPVSLAAEAFAHFREWTANAPDELTSSIVLMNFPPVPALPDFLRGQSFVIIRGCYVGDVQEGEALLAFWRDWRKPILDDFNLKPFSEIAKVSNDPVDPLPGRGSGAWLNDLDDETVETLIRFASPSALVFAEVRHAGGAIQRIDPAETAYSHRNEQYLLNVIASTPTPKAQAAAHAHFAEMKRTLRGHPSDAVYMNFLEGEEARARTRQGYSSSHYQKLLDIKTKYDPQNRFSHSYKLVK